MSRVLVALGIMVGIGMSIASIRGSAPGGEVLTATIDDRATASAAVSVSVPAEPATPGVVDGSVAPAPESTAPQADPNDAPFAPGHSAPADLPDTSFDGLLWRAIVAGVPDASGATVIASSCHGDTGRPHWGYFNNGATGGTVFEPDGVTVPVGAICLNPSQPDAYSSLVHELGHKWFWETGLWAAGASTFGSTERAAECFARVYGATVFGSGGCPDSLLSVMGSIAGR